MRREALLWVVLAGLGVALLALFVGGGDGSVAGLPSDSFARLAYLGAWGAVLATGLVLFARTRLGAALKSAAIWIAAFAVLIAAYGFAPELDSLKNRMLAVLMPGTMVSLDDGADATAGRYLVTRGRDDHFRLDGTIDGQPVRFMVDTGASTIAFDRGTARSVGIDPDALTYDRRVMTANGITRAATITLDRVSLGDIVRENVPAAVTDSTGLDSVLLGMSFLETLSSVDFRGDRLILTD